MEDCSCQVIFVEKWILFKDCIWDLLQFYFGIFNIVMFLIVLFLHNSIYIAFC